MIEKAHGGKPSAGDHGYIHHAENKSVKAFDAKSPSISSWKERWHFNDKQWKQFMRNLANMMVNQIKQDEKRMKKASEKLKKSIEGQG